MALKFSMILEAIDRASAPAKRAQATVQKLTGGVRKWGQQVGQSSRQIEAGGARAEAALGGVAVAAGKMGADIDRAAHRLDAAGQSIDRYGQRAKSGFARMGSGVRRWGQDVRKVSRDIQSGARSVEFYETRARRLRQVALGTFFRAAGQQARRFGSDLRSGIRNLDMMARAGRAARASTSWLGRKSLDAAKGGAGWLGGKALSAAKWGAAGVGAAGIFALGDLFRTAGQFEQFQVVLEGTEGSAQKAKKAMAWVRQFAQDTPYELADVTDAFVRARQLGIDPMNNTLRIMGDAAAGSRKELMDAVDAIGDAQTKEYERLKEFGITTSVKGETVTFSYVDKGGKNALKTVKSDAVSIRNAVLDIWSTKFSGNMIRLSRTLFGIWKNIKDVAASFLMMVADAGIFEKVKGQLSAWYDRLNTMAKDGRMKAWAQAISDQLSQAFNWAVRFTENTDWGAVGRGLATGISALARIIELIGQAATKFERFQASRAAAMAENTENGWFTSAANKASARARRQVIERQYGPLTDTGRQEAMNAARAKAALSDNRLRDDINATRWKRAQQRGLLPAGSAIRTRPAATTPPRASSTTWQRALAKPATGAFRRLPATGGKPAAAPATKIGGALDIDIKVQGGATASVKRVATANRAVPIRAKVGKVMGADA